MSRYPFFLVLALAGAALLLTGMVSRQAAPPAAAAPDSQPASAADIPEPGRLLDRAVAAYAPARVVWAELKFWQQTQSNGSVCEVVGRYLAAPGDRVRLELQTQVGATRGELKMISDGEQVWQWQRVGSAPPAVTLFPLLTVRPGTTPGQAACTRTEALRYHTFGGVGPLLQALRGRLRQLQAKAVRWKGLEILQLSGAWPEDPAKLAEVPDYVRPRQVPRRCSLYLDARTLWPHRLEWWYSERPEDTPVLLMQTELRDPVLNRPLPPARLAQEFTIPK